MPKWTPTGRHPPKNLLGLVARGDIWGWVVGGCNSVPKFRPVHDLNTATTMATRVGERTGGERAGGQRAEGQRRGGNGRGVRGEEEWRAMDAKCCSAKLSRT